MALPSQMARTGEMGRGVKGFGGGGGRRTKRLIGPVALLLAAGGVLGVWWVMKDDAKPDTGEATQARTAQPEAARANGEATRDPLVATFAALPNASPPARGSTTPPPPVKDAPAEKPASEPESKPLSVIEMGAKRPAAGGTVAATPSTTPVQTPTTTPASTDESAPVTPVATTPVEEPSSTSPVAAAAMLEVDRLLAENKPVDARLVLSRAVNAPGLSEAERSALRARAGALTDRLLFSPTATAGDPMTEVYAVASGDSLVRIAANRKTMTDWRLIQRINGISDPGKLRVGQKLKLVKGPFHAVVVKSAYRLDLYADIPDGSSTGFQRVYLKSFPVGLGENNSTPLGNFVVRPNSKLINPTWTNPRTGEFFAADNPKNPIGEHWIGLDPADDATKAHTQYGLHGTIEPESIGQQKSMGCVRLGTQDIALLYELLVDRASTVRIVP